MSYFTIYVGGERYNRANTQEDELNVNKVLSLHTSGGCYTNLGIGQIEHVLPVLVSISYIQGKNNLNIIVDMIKNTGVTAYSVVSHGNDEECLQEESYTEYVI